LIHLISGATMAFVNYLYGDSTPSPLTSNVLEFLKDALDFSVFVLKADDRIKHGKEQVRAFEERVRGRARQARSLHRSRAEVDRRG
jgi:hypothetical protein